MERRIEERKCGPLPGTVERLADASVVPPFDIQGRERLKRPTDFLERQSAKMPLFKRGIPLAEKLFADHEIGLDPCVTRG
jgi:hypothetical protein